MPLSVDNIFGGSYTAPSPAGSSNNRFSVDNIFGSSEPTSNEKVDKAVENLDSPIATHIKSGLFSDIFNTKGLDSARARSSELVNPKDNSTAGIINNTIKGLPKAAWNFLGPGKIQDYLNTPEGEQAAANLTFKDVRQNIIPTVGKVVAQPAVDLAGIFTGPKTFNIPAIGKVENIEKTTYDATQNGENPYEAVFNAVPQAIFDGLAVAGIAEKVFSPRESVVATGVKTNDLPGAAEIPGDKSFRLSKPPKVTSNSIPNEAIDRLQQEQGVKFKNFDPERPTYFRQTPKGNGVIKGEIVQVKPSYFDTFIKKFNGDIHEVPPSETSTVYEKTTSLDEIKHNLENTSTQPPVANPENFNAIAEQVKTQTPEEPKFNAKPSENASTSIPKELQPLAEEAKKYKTPEEFVNAKKGKEALYSLNKKGVDTVYHETDPQTARNIIFSDQVRGGLNVSTSPELALGQGGKGARIEFDTRRLEGGKIIKPGADFVEGVTGKYPEYQISNGPHKITPDVKSIIFDKPLSPKGEVNMFGFREDWKATKEILPDGKVKYSNPNYKSTKELEDIHKQATQSKEPKFNTEARKTLPERPVEPQRVTEYKDRLKLKGADPVLVDAIITPEGGRAYGVSANGTLTFEKIVEHLTEDHEVFHQVFSNMDKMRVFKDFDKKALFSEAKDLYGDLSEAQLEEEMAKDFQQYVNEKESGKSTSFFGKIKEFFDRLYNSVKRLFRGEKDIKDFYKAVHERTATEETAIEDKATEAFNKQREKGTIDFRAIEEGSFNSKPGAVEQLQKQRERYERSLEAYTENPQIHIQAYGEDRSQIYRDKITEINKKIKEIKNPSIDTGNKLEDMKKHLAQVEARMGVNPADKLDYLSSAIDCQKEIIDQHPGKVLQKLISKKEGQFLDPKNPTTIDSKTGKFKYSPTKQKQIIKQNKRIESISQTAFEATPFSDQFDNPDVIREALDEFDKEKESLKEMKEERILTSKEFKTYVKIQKKIIRQEINQGKLEAKDEEALDKMARDRAYREMPQSLSEVVPPVVRGGIQSPELHFEKWHDESAPRLTRETFERNIENVAPKQDEIKIKESIIDPIRRNEMERVKFNNDLRTRTKDEMKKLELVRGSTESELIQKYGEGLMSVTELEKASPKKWQEIQKASTYYRNQYDMLLDKWNAVRKEFGYPEVGKRHDYFRHFDEINFLAKSYGLINKSDNLPTTIAGKTEFFKPGKPFTTAELHRTGNRTKYDAIAGFDNYLDTVSKQIFHTDSIQRGRALEKYIERSAKVAEMLGQPIHLQNFVTQLREYINNGLGGKKASIDRVLETYAGRPVISAFERVSKLIGKNIIVGNISTALSHLVTLPLIASTTDKIPLMKGLTTTLTSPFMKGGFADIDGQESSFLTRRYPIEKTMRSKPETAEHALSYLFEATDKFKSRLAVSAKYYEGIRDGLSLEEAMKEADRYAGKVLGDYSYGQRPNLMNAQTMSIIAQFQLGLNDSLSVLFHDIPEDEKTYTEGENGDFTSKTKKWNVVSKFVQFAIFSYLFNKVLKNIRGSGKGIDPIDTALTLTGMNDEGSGQTLPARFALAGKDLFGELPFSSVFTGNFPLSTAIKTPIQDLSKGDVKSFFEDLLASVGSPIGGGLQAKKTIEGIQSYNQGIVNSKAGNPNFVVNKNPINAFKMALFGENSTEEAQSYYNSIDATSAGKTLLDQLKQLKKEGKIDEAKQLIENLSPSDLKSLQSSASAEKAKATKVAEAAMVPTVQNVIALKKEGKIDEAKKIIEGLSEDQKKYFVGAAKMLKSAQTETVKTFGSGTTTWEKQGFLTHIFNIARASTMHPIQMFDNVFDGAGDWRVTDVKNGQVIVNRMSLSASEAIKRNEGGDNSDWKLDHIFPLEAGGNNSIDNLQLIPTEQWSANTSVENLIANKLSNGKITGEQAKEFAIRYKAGQGEILSPAYMDLYKKKYGGKSITEEEISNY